MLPAGETLDDRAHRHAARAGRVGRAAADGDGRARRRARRRPRRHDRARPASPPAVARHLEATDLLDGTRRRCAPARATSSSTPRAACGRRSRRSSRAWTWRRSTPSSGPDELELNDIGQRAPAHHGAAARRPVQPQPRVGRVHPRRRDDVRDRRRGHDRDGHARRPAGPLGPHSPDVVWHDPPMPRRERWDILGVRGATIWLTGLPGAGKSTIGEELERRLVAAGPPRLPARRREPAPRPQRRPRLLRRRPPRARAPRRQRGEPPRRHGQRRDRRARLPDGAPTAPTRASCTSRPTCASSRPGSTRRWRSASGATPPGLYRRAWAGRADRASRASTRPTRSPTGPTCACTAPTSRSSARSSACSRRSTRLSPR